MFDFNSWEFLALGVAAILIFGPERLPGMIRKAGEYYAQLQSVAATFRRELEAETSEITQPLKEAVAGVSAVGQEIAAAGKDVGQLAAGAPSPSSEVAEEDGSEASDVGKTDPVPTPPNPPPQIPSADRTVEQTGDVTNHDLKP